MFQFATNHVTILINLLYNYILVNVFANFLIWYDPCGARVDGLVSTISLMRIPKVFLLGFGGKMSEGFWR